MIERERDASFSSLTKFASPPSPANSCFERRYEPLVAMKGSSRVSRTTVCEMDDLTV